ncbi:MAG: radical SAM family heme chaperone HemW [Candidatus Sericytochromatia bacterium]|nr:radical SAM family heme chaperone HemW [Candidatus Tanganyikabacteria bacterium]
MPPGIGLYVHVPFCAIKCHYCDFACYTGLDSLMEPYVAALIAEMKCYEPCDVASIYLGGGTPSLLPPALLGRLLAAAHEHFLISPAAEVTLEVNPGTGAPGLWETALAGGVNRLSVGVQAFDDLELAAIGRDHTVRDVDRTICDVRAAGFHDVSLDLIYGLPDQSEPGWARTVAEALARGPEHFSVYSLQVEERTVFGARERAGDLPLPGEDAERGMHDHLDAALDCAGFRRYEISSWCRPGHESVHNRLYWHNRDYIGLGSGAHSYFQGRRYSHGRSVKAYLRDPQPRIPPDRQPRQEEMEETIFMGLRLVREGLSRERFAARFGSDVREFYAAEIDQLVALGMLEESPEALRLSRDAIPVANDVFAAFLR